MVAVLEPWTASGIVFVGGLNVGGGNPGKVGPEGSAALASCKVCED